MPAAALSGRARFADPAGRRDPLHIPLIHALALVVSRIRLGDVSPWLFTNHPMGNPPAPDGYPWGLPLLSMVWLVAIVMLYPACRWFADLEAKRGSRWLSYL